MTATNTRAHSKRAPVFPTLVLIPHAATLPAHRLADLQTLADVFADEHGDTPDVTKVRRAVLGARVGASREELDALTRRAEQRAHRAWDRAIREGLTDLTAPAVPAA